MTKVNERNMILDILQDIDKKKAYPAKVLDDYFYVYELNKQQKSFIRRIVYGTIEHGLYLDFCLNQVSKVKVNKMKPIIRYILRMSVYQLYFMDKVPDHATLNEAVKLVQKRKFYQLKGFVNGVLRNIVRNRSQIQDQIEALPYIKRLSVMYSMNEELVDYLAKQYSENELVSFLEESLKDKKTCIRTNTEKIKPEELKEKLKPYGRIEEGHLHVESFYLSDYNDLTLMPGYQDGEFLVQDESSTLVGLVADPKPDNTILDVCAAPGGKSLHLGELLRGSGQVTACDISESKVDIINDNINRLGMQNIATKLWDATMENKSWLSQFDIVVTDVPCSGLGILRGKPDIKNNMTLDKINSLIDIQKKILNQAAKYVKCGGTLIYSTCTVNKQENIEQVEGFIKEHPNYEWIDLQEMEVLQPVTDSISDKCLALMTDASKTDGFFIAKLRKMRG